MVQVDFIFWTRKAWFYGGAISAYTSIEILLLTGNNFWELYQKIKIEMSEQFF